MGREKLTLTRLSVAEGSSSFVNLPSSLQVFVYRKTGAFTERPRRSVDGEFGYRFLAAFFFPPLAAFFAMLRIPPFLGSSVCE